jgi:hypothetical protein
MQVTLTVCISEFMLKCWLLLITDGKSKYIYMYIETAVAVVLIS